MVYFKSKRKFYFFDSKKGLFVHHTHQWFEIYYINISFILVAYHPQTAWLSSNTEYKGRTWTRKQISWLHDHQNIMEVLTNSTKKHFKKIEQEYPKLYMELNVSVLVNVQYSISIFLNFLSNNGTLYIFYLFINVNMTKMLSWYTVLTI